MASCSTADLFPGRVGAALTGTRDESRMALRASAAQEVAFGTKRGAYPSTGIGAYAFIRQAYLDAQYEARLDKAMKAGIPGARPSNDPFSRALMAAAANEMPSWFVASTERELTRVAEISKEMGIKSPVVVGAREGYRSVVGAQGERGDGDRQPRVAGARFGDGPRVPVDRFGQAAVRTRPSSIRQ